MTTQSDTPRTDAAFAHEGEWDTKAFRMNAVAASLERELNADNERIKRLEEAGDWLVAQSVDIGFNDWIKLKQLWDQAKETKR
jgi:hypothetical protein